MNTQIAARHMHLTAALVNYINKKIQRIHKYCFNNKAAHVVLDCEKHRQSAQIIVHAFGITFRAKDISTNMYAAIDGVIDKIDIQLKKYKEKRYVHHGLKKNQTEAGALCDSLPIMRKESLVPKIMSISEASTFLESTGKKSLIFVESETQHVHVLEKKNKEYSLLEIVS